MTRCNCQYNIHIHVGTSKSFLLQHQIHGTILSFGTTFVRYYLTLFTAFHAALTINDITFSTLNILKTLETYYEHSPTKDLYCEKCKKSILSLKELLDITKLHLYSNNTIKDIHSYLQHINLSIDPLKTQP